jgi:hypothetical protein
VSRPIVVSLLPFLAFPAPCDAAGQAEPGAAAETRLAASDPAPANPFGRKYPPRVYQTVRLQGPPPSIDGRLDDTAWQEGAWAGGYKQQLPVEGAPPSAETELKILFDDKHLYFAIRAFDDPAKVHRYPGRRDDFQGFAVDMVGICFDSYNDKRTGFEFDLTAGGGKIDLILGNGETEWDTTWDAVWDGEVAHDEKGWTAEFRVPLNQLRYGPQDEQVWGLHAWRWIARNQEEVQWQLIPRQNTGRMYQLGELHGIRGLPPARHVELLPHVVAKAASGPSVPGEGTDGSGSIGLDAKVGLSSNFTLDATLNPDFGQVEADPSVVNLTAYETFYEEKRPFFLEGRKILDFRIEEDDQLFYSRRIGAAPAYVPPAGDGAALRMPESTTILGAAKVTGKTEGGLSVGVLQSVTQEERASFSSPLGAGEPVVVPLTSYTVARVQKDWDKGNTMLGALATGTHRFGDDAVLSFLPRRAWTGGLDFTRYFGNRALQLEARAVLSRIEGERSAILELQRSPVHYFQREGASHLGVDPGATSLSGHSGFVRASSSQSRRFRVSDQFHWYSPGLDLNDVGYLRQADLKANDLYLSWSQPSPKGPFRAYGIEVSRDDQWDFGGLHTLGATEVEAGGTLRNKWRVSAELSYQEVVDTRALRGGPALRWHDYFEAGLSLESDNSRRAFFGLEAEHAWATDDDSWSSSVLARANLRPTNRLLLAAETSFDRLNDNLQYVTTAAAAGGPRYVLSHIKQDTWSLTLRVNLALTPDLTLQYYGSPFIGTGRYTAFKRATDTLAKRHEDRFHLYGPDEIALGTDGRYVVDEEGGGRYSFANPDFSFRQFRSNLVLRWEYRPGSSVYAVWSQGRTDEVATWSSSFRANWDELWRTTPDNVFLVKISHWFSP